MTNKSGREEAWSLSFATINVRPNAQHTQAPEETVLRPSLGKPGLNLVPRVVTQPLYFILQTQFLTLQFHDLELVGRWPSLLFFDFTIQRAVPVRELIEVCV